MLAVMKIDHFMYAVASLDEGMAWAEDLFGVAPIAGGSHEGLGTRNALLALRASAAERCEASSGRKLAGEDGMGRNTEPARRFGALGDTYLEIIAPDPAQSVENQMVERMAKLSSGGLVTWAAEGDLTVTKGLLEEAGISSLGPAETRRRTAEGELLVWDLLFPQGGGYGMPFFIDWRDCPHPAATTPVGGKLQSLDISSPDARTLGPVLGGLGLSVAVSEGEPELRVGIEGANGRVELVSTEETRRLQPSSRR